jgi:polyketide synthase 12
MSQARHTGKVALTVPRGLDPEGTVLITGATGSLAQLLAHHLVTEHGIRHLLLASRRGPTADSAAQLTADLNAAGAQATLTACDVTDPAALTTLLDTIPHSHPLTAVIHTAGVLDDGLITTLTDEQLTTVLKPKVDAAWHLHHLTRHHDLAAFVLYSSAAGLLGNAGQANYAAANTFLDALAHHRHTQGLPATSLAWGLWNTTHGMAAQLDERALGRLAQTGVLPLSAGEGLRQFDSALALRQPLAVGLGVDTSVLAERAASGLLDPLFSRLAQGRPARKGGAAARRTGGGGGQPPAERIASLSDAARRDALRELVLASAAAVLGHSSPAGVDPERPFTALGFDSLSAYELRNQLTAGTGLRLSPTLIFDHPTPDALAAHLDESLAPERQDPFAALLSELDRLQEGLTRDDVRPGPVGRVVTRLQDFLGRLEESRNVPEEGGRELSVATDDEIFDLIDNELGIA